MIEHRTGPHALSAYAYMLYRDFDSRQPTLALGTQRADDRNHLRLVRLELRSNGVAAVDDSLDARQIRAFVGLVGTIENGAELDVAVVGHGAGTSIGTFVVNNHPVEIVRADGDDLNAVGKDVGVVGELTRTKAGAVDDDARGRVRRQVARAQEQLAAIKSIRAMERTHVVVLVIDATEGVTDQDQRIARMAFERGKGVVVLLHKWDLVKDDRARASEIAKQSAEALAFLEEPDLIKTSIVGHGRDAGQGHARNLDVVMKAVRRTAKALSRRISTSDLNDELQRAVAELSPPAHRGNLVRLYFATQAGVEPPLFAISANRGRSLPPAYERYLLRRFRKRWDLHGVPLRIVVRGRGRGGHMPGESRDD